MQEPKFLSAEQFLLTTLVVKVAIGAVLSTMLVRFPWFRRILLTEKRDWPERLIFASRTTPQKHLARQQLADLFLDTLPYNAHTTASDALWAGLPVLTCNGNTFAGRVAGSLLRAIGLPELITGSLDEYERAALDLARDRQRLIALRQRLEKNRGTSALFNLPRYTRNIEAAYARMWQTWLSGKPPESFSIESA